MIPALLTRRPVRIITKTKETPPYRKRLKELSVKGFKMKNKLLQKKLK